jgi:hypothetical protein
MCHSFLLIHLIFYYLLYAFEIGASGRGEKVFTDLRAIQTYSRNMRQPAPIQYDLPVANLQENNHYIPPMAWDKAEAARRGQQVPGSLILEAQHDGTRITQELTEILRNEDRDAYDDFLRRMGGVLLNTSWHNYARIENDTSVARQDNVGRRALTLPRHVRIEEDGTIAYETQEGNDQVIQNQLARAAVLSAELERAHKRSANGAKFTAQRKYGRTIGELGFLFAASDLLGQRDDDPRKIQTAVRSAGIQAIEASRETHDGVYLTIAQFADPHSQLSTYFARSKDIPSLTKKSVLSVSEQVRNERGIRNVS